MALERSMTGPVEPHPEGVVLRVWVLPRSSKNMLAGRHGDTLKIKLTAPPVGGAANKMCIAFLARRLGLPKASLEILAGRSRRRKLVLVRPAGDRMDPEAVKDLKKRLASLTGT
jgi:uncharacterized protein (TIGR00251 family)